MSREPYPCTPGEFWETETPNADRVTGKPATVYTPPEDVVQEAHKASPGQVEAALGEFTNMHLNVIRTMKRIFGAEVGDSVDVLLEQAADQFTQSVADAVAVADAEQEALRAEVERLTGALAGQDEWLDAATEAADRRLDESVEWMHRAVAAEAEVERLRKYAPSPEFEALLAASSLGSPEVLALRDTVSDDVARTIVLLAKQMDRAEAAEAKVAAGLALADEWEAEAVRYGEYAKGSSITVQHRVVQRALKGNATALRAVLSGPSEPTCGADITHRDDDHRQSVCVLPASHASAHDDGQGCRWTDADHHGPDDAMCAASPPASLSTTPRVLGGWYRSRGSASPLQAGASGSTSCAVTSTQRPHEW